MNATKDTQNQSTSEKVVERGERDAAKGLARLKRKPAIGVVLAGGLGVLAASVIGVGEVAIAMAAGYAAYRALHA